MKKMVSPAVTVEDSEHCIDELAVFLLAPSWTRVPACAWAGGLRATMNASMTKRKTAANVAAFAARNFILMVAHRR